MSASETEIIIEHALLNESNMVLAAKVGAAYERLQRRVILRFLERIRDELRSEFGPEWSVERELEEKPAPHLFARHTSWPEEINFGVAGDNGCIKQVYLFVGTNRGAVVGNAQLNQELERSLTTTRGRWRSFPKGYYSNLDRFSQWGEPETLVDIYRASEALEYVKALLMGTRDAIAPVIDSQLKLPA